jgi:release factor glutamine methyltransferase
MTNAYSIKTTLLLAATQLKAQGIEVEIAKLEAQLLLQHALNVNRAWLIAHEHENLTHSIEAAYRAMLERRLNGEPIAYILGVREFYGLNLKVTADTLIPRADTETMVEAALAKIALLLAPSPQPSPTGGEGVKAVQSSADSSTSPLSPTLSRKRARGQIAQAFHLQHHLNLASQSPLPPAGEGLGERGDIAERANDGISILDLGTGTGAIALAIAKHAPQTHVTALDASQAALDIAIENAQNLNIPNVNFILSDWFSGIQNEKFDVIVSNPPYIEATDAHLKQGDLRYEPISALASGADGLDAIRTIITQSLHHLNPHGWLMLEHGYNQASAVSKLLLQHQFTEISTIKDFGGNDRVTTGRLAN